MTSTRPPRDLPRSLPPVVGIQASGNQRSVETRDRACSIIRQKARLVVELERLFPICGPETFLATSCAEMDILRPVQWSFLILLALPNSLHGVAQCQRNSPVVVSRDPISTKLGVERIRHLHAHSVTERPQTPYHMPKPSNMKSADDVEHFVH